MSKSNPFGVLLLLSSRTSKREPVSQPKEALQPLQWFFRGIDSD
jgi:hypothetical protein